MNLCEYKITLGPGVLLVTAFAQQMQPLGSIPETKKHTDKVLSKHRSF